MLYSFEDGIFQMPTSADEKAEAERIQAERREYVKNIGIEYRFGCYEVIVFLN